MCMAVLSVYHECAWCPWWPEEGIRTTDQNGSHRWLLVAIWVVEVESRSCARQAGTLSHWAMSPGLIIIFLTDRNLKNYFWCLILLFKQWVFNKKKKPSHVKNMFKKYTNKQNQRSSNDQDSRISYSNISKDRGRKEHKFLCSIHDRGSSILKRITYQATSGIFFFGFQVLSRNSNNWIQDLICG